MDFVAEVVDPETSYCADAFGTVILLSTFARNTLPSAAGGDAWYSPNPTTLSSDKPNIHLHSGNGPRVLLPTQQSGRRSQRVELP